MRRGSFVLIPMLCLILALAVVGQILQQSQVEAKQLKQQQYLLQASSLGDAAAQRAVRRMIQDTDYDGETWKVEVESMGKVNPGEVVIEVEKNRQMEDSYIITTKASYPADDIYRVRVIREWPITVKSQNSE
ncbi:hypothetical protein FYZ48_06800 [Gimesia chilikensis]|uniref:hypothetical protein n=1 Tax=Gimesia chilikensis TaxID=2605989 RepID=UPI0011EBA765|nr:hypothetical protein [Gimesia chilikensis]KAA0140977.1 hypothetical protein FYZ48_06800 [Gimesia chilikensis]